MENEADELNVGIENEVHQNKTKEQEHTNDCEIISNGERLCPKLGCQWKHDLFSSQKKHIVYVLTLNQTATVAFLS